MKNKIKNIVGLAFLLLTGYNSQAQMDLEDNRVLKLVKTQ